MTKHTSIVVLGASGDLAFKKTYPALFALFCAGHLPSPCHIIGYARSKITDDEFKTRISSKFKCHSEKDQENVSAFLSLCSYFSGAYDSLESYAKLAEYLKTYEGVSAIKHRIFYMALPPSVFIPASEGLKTCVYSPPPGTNRLIVEKPFGKDLESFRELSKSLAKNWSESEVFINRF